MPNKHSTRNTGISDPTKDPMDIRVANYIAEKEKAMNIDWFAIELETMAIKLGICIHCLKKKLAK